MHYPRRYAVGTDRIREWIHAGRVGLPSAVHAWYGTTVRHLGVHSLDLVYHLLGPSAYASALPSREEPVVVLSGGDAPELLLQPYPYRHFPLMDLDILGSEGRIRITDLGSRMTLWRARASRVHTGFRELREVSCRPTGFENATRRLYGRVARDLDCGSTPVEISERYMARACDAIERAIKERNTCRI